MQTNLKTLSRQYANGMISKEEYRRARLDLLETVQEDGLTQPQSTVPLSTPEDEEDAQEARPDGE